MKEKNRIRNKRKLQVATIEEKKKKNSSEKICTQDYKLSYKVLCEVARKDIINSRLMVQVTFPIKRKRKRLLEY